MVHTWYQFVVWLRLTQFTLLMTIPSPNVLLRKVSCLWADNLLPASIHVSACLYIGKLRKTYFLFMYLLEILSLKRHLFSPYMTLGFIAVQYYGMRAIPGSHYPRLTIIKAVPDRVETKVQIRVTPNSPLRCWYGWYITCVLAFFLRHLPKWPVFHRIRVLKWRQGPGELWIWRSVGGLERIAPDGSRTGGSWKRAWIWAPWSPLGQCSDLQDWGQVCRERFTWRENDGRESWRPCELNWLHSLAAKKR